MQAFSEEAEELTADAELMPLSDRLSGMVALALGRVIRDLTASPLETPEQRQELLELARELAQLRKGDHKAKLLRVELERHEAEAEKESKRKEKADQHEWDWGPLQYLSNVQRKEQMLRLITQGLSSDKVAHIRDFVGMAPLQKPDEGGGPGSHSE